MTGFVVNVTGFVKNTTGFDKKGLTDVNGMAVRQFGLSLVFNPIKTKTVPGEPRAIMIGDNYKW